MSECGGKGKEWLRVSPRFLTWMSRRMVLFTKRRHTLGEAGWLENITSSVLSTLNLRCVTHSVGLFHVVGWICCTGKREIQMSNFSPRRKQLLRKVGLK